MPKSRPVLNYAHQGKTPADLMWQVGNTIYHMGRGEIVEPIKITFEDNMHVARWKARPDENIFSGK